MKHSMPCRAAWDFPNPGLKASSPILQADSLPSEPPGKPEISAKNGNFGPKRPTDLRLTHMCLPLMDRVTLGTHLNLSELRFPPA